MICGNTVLTGGSWRWLLLEYISGAADLEIGTGLLENNR
jgi:hypothetical protein